MKSAREKKHRSVPASVSTAGRISGKILFRCLCAFLICFVISVLLTSCSETQKSSDYKDVISALESIYGSQTEKSENKTYRIVLSSECSPELYNMASGLAVKIESISGGKVGIIYDSQYSQSDYCDIIIGEVYLDKSCDFLNGLKVDDYGYDIADDCILIAGHSDEKSIAALATFCEALTNNESLLSTCKSEYVRGEYDFDRVTLNGFELSSYMIVYPEKEVYGVDVRTAAETFGRNIADICGYDLRVACENVIDISQNVIYYGYSSLNQKYKTLQSDEIQIVLSGHDICLNSNSTYGIYRASEYLCDRIKNADRNGKNGYAVISDVTLVYDNSEIICESFVSDGTWEIEDYAYIYTAAASENADIVSFGGLSDVDLYHLSLNLSRHYSIAGNSGADDVMCPVFYKQDLAECISYETLRYHGGIVAVCGFRRISDGYEYIYVNGYLEDKECEMDFVKALAQTVSEYSAGRSVIVAHNFTDVSSAAFSNMAASFEKASLYADGDAGSSSDSCTMLFVTYERLSVKKYQQPENGVLAKLDILY